MLFTATGFKLKLTMQALNAMWYPIRLKVLQKTGGGTATLSRTTSAGRFGLACGVALLGLTSTPALAEPDPKSLDQTLTETLGLGKNTGCDTGFGITDADSSGSIDDELTLLRGANQLGRELTAVCGSSAVTSAAALGGSLGSLQTTKTVSQFHLTRRRIDSRLGVRGKRFGLGGWATLAALDNPIRPTRTDATDFESMPESRLSVFAQADYEQRDRHTTTLEAGYEANISGGLIGIDYVMPVGLLIGAWAGYGYTDAEYTGTNLLINRGQPSALTNSLTPALLVDICNLSPGGEFDAQSFKLGGFVGTRFGRGFADVALQYNRGDYDYQRNICAIEAPSTTNPIIVDNGFPSGFSNGGVQVDDIFAGTISGKTTLTEWSVSARTGFDFGDERLLWGPRVSITYLRSELDGFTETGETSVTNSVLSNGGLLTTRAPGEPIGLELAFDKQSRTSLQTEAQFVAAYRFESRFGAIIPRVSASWIHEFRGERELVGIRMAQDYRASPTRLSFTTDSVDKDKGIIALGVTALVSESFAADLRVTHLVADKKFDSTTVAAQARWRF